MVMTIGIYEAKTRLPAIVSAIESTLEEVIVTRHGKPVAKIVPIRDEAAERAERIARLRSMRSTRIGPAMSADELVEMIHEGRRM